jgi:2'-hydroxyisoflavone reductase
MCSYAEARTFIGRSIAEQLAQDHAVTVLNRGSTPPPAGVVYHARADRTDATAVRAALAGLGPFDVVVDVSATEAAHVQGLLAGLGPALPPAYVLISSAAVYSPRAPFPRQEDAETAGDPVWGGYGEEKANCERLLREAGIAALTFLRPPYVYGPGNNEDRERWLWSRMVNGRPIYVPSKNGSRIQFCHVSFLSSVVAAAVAARIPADTYNVGEDRAYTFDEYLSVLADTCGHRPQVVHTGDTDAPARRYFPFRDIDLVLEITRLRAADVEPGPELRTGLAETWAWISAVGVPAYEPTSQEAMWSSGRP